MLGFKNVKTYIKGKGVVTTNIAIDGDKICKIGDVKITDPLPYSQGQIVVPGFIDRHIHGALGSDVMDGTKDSLKNIAVSLTREGTTAFLATTMTQERSNIIKSLSAVKEYMKTDNLSGAELLGAHLEGPFISPDFIGAQPKEHISSPIIELFNEFNRASGNNIKVVTLAPELDGASELIKHLANLGIVSSAGHTNANHLQIENACALGLSSITHTFNAQKGIHHRDIGTAGAGLLIDKLYTEIICDLVHLSVGAVKLILKCKPKDKIVAITDSMRAKYLPNGESELGGQKVIVNNGEARLENGALAGSVLKMNNALANLVLKCDVPFETAIDFMTANPALSLGVYDKMGSITEGKLANFAVLDGDLSVALTVRNGKIVYKA